MEAFTGRLPSSKSKICGGAGEQNNDYVYDRWAIANSLARDANEILGTLEAMLLQIFRRRHARGVGVH